MRKVSLLVGTLGGAMAGYLFSNKKLREELSSAKNADEAAKTLAKYLQQDGKKVASEIKDFVQSDEVQKNMGKAKTFAQKKMMEAKKELQKFVKKGKNSAMGAMKKKTGAAKKAVEKK